MLYASCICRLAYGYTPFDHMRSARRNAAMRIFFKSSQGFHCLSNKCVTTQDYWGILRIVRGLFLCWRHNIQPAPKKLLRFRIF